MSYGKPRIGVQDTIMDAVVKLVGGNPGATMVVAQMLKLSPTIDPQTGCGIFPLLLLDTEGIYEERIWMLYKDVCKQDIVKTLACLRASQLGFISSTQLNKAIDGMEDLDVDALLAKVKEKVNGFDELKNTIESEFIERSKQ